MINIHLLKLNSLIIDKTCDWIRVDSIHYSAISGDNYAQFTARWQHVQTWVLDFNWWSVRPLKSNQSASRLLLFPSTVTKMAVIINTTALSGASAVRNIQMNQIFSSFYREITLTYLNTQGSNLLRNPLINWKWILRSQLIVVRSSDSSRPGFARSQSVEERSSWRRQLTEGSFLNALKLKAKQL